MEEKAREISELSKEHDFQWMKDLSKDDYKILSEDGNPRWVHLVNNAVIKALKQERDIKRKQVEELETKLESLILINIKGENKDKAVAFALVKDFLIQEVFKDMSLNTNKTHKD